MKQVVATEAFRRHWARSAAGVYGEWAAGHVRDAIRNEHPGGDWWERLAVADTVRAAHEARIALGETQ